MHPYRVIVLTYRRSSVLSVRPYIHNTLTLQSTDTNDAPRDPLHDPVAWNPAQTQPYSTSTASNVSAVVAITTSTAPLHQDPSLCSIRYLTLAPSLESAVPFWQPFSTGFDSIVFRFDNLIRLNCFPILLDSIGVFRFGSTHV